MAPLTQFWEVNAPAILEGSLSFAPPIDVLSSTHSREKRDNTIPCCEAVDLHKAMFVWLSSRDEVCEKTVLRCLPVVLGVRLAA